MKLCVRVAVVVALAAAGCKDKPAAQPAAGSAAQPVAGSAAQPAAGGAGAGAGSASAAAGSGTGLAGGGGGGAAMLPECAEYKAAIDKLMTCERLSQSARDALFNAFQQASATWSTATPETRVTLKKACKDGADAALGVAKAQCGG